MRHRYLFIAGFFLFGIISAAAAQDSDGAFRCPKPGTTLLRSTGQTIVAVSGGEGLRCVFNAGKGNYDFYSHITYARSYSDDITKLWPLQVGKGVDYLITTARWKVRGGLVGAATPLQVRMHVETVRKETIDIKAGRFDTYVIEQSDGSSVYDYWYSSKVGEVVKFAYASKSTPTRLHSWEAASVTVP